MRRNVVEYDIGFGDPARESVNFSAVECMLRPCRSIQPAGTKHHDRRRRAHCHASRRLCTRIMEKYGTSSGLTWSSGSVVCSGRVAWAI